MIVVVFEDPSERRRALEALSSRGASCLLADDAAHAVSLVRSARVDAVLLDDASSGPSFEHAGAVAGSSSRGVETVVLTRGSTMEGAVAAMRAGVRDLIRADATDRELASRVLAAARRAFGARREDERSRRLRSLCKGLSRSRRELSAQVGSMCENLATAYRDLADQIGLISLSAEFGAALRPELDIENALRVGLEFMLTRTGPTNAAVFLPSTTGDFSLGAYVNYDIGADSAEVLMDHLAASAAPRLQEQREPVLLSSDAELRSRLGDAAEWLRDVSVIAFACRHEGECLAVFQLFRDRATPFSASQLPAVALMADLFSRHLAKIVRVHHRHMPKHKWGTPGDPSDGIDDIDLAA